MAKELPEFEKYAIHKYSFCLIARYKKGAITWLTEAQADEIIRRCKAYNPWILVSERLPKSPTQYLCCYYPYGSDLPQIYTATTWSKAKGFFLENGQRVFPTHWKPIVLPEQALSEEKPNG